MKTTFKIIAFIVTLRLLAGAEQISSDSEIPPNNDFFQKLGLDVNFKDFDWQIISEDGSDSNAKVVNITINNQLGKNLTGISLHYDALKGELLSIKPILTRSDDQEKVSMILMAFENYHEQMIAFDTLWEVVNSISRPNDESELISLLVSGLSTDPGVNDISILPNGPVMRSIKDINMNQFIVDNKLKLLDLMLHMIKSASEEVNIDENEKKE